jgi:hypothetical protein
LQNVRPLSHHMNTNRSAKKMLNEANKMKNLTGKILAVLGAFALVALSATAILAAPGDVSPANDIPATAQSIDGQMHNIGPNGSLWYEFQYSAARDEDRHRDVRTLTMPNATGTGLGFEIYTPAQIADWWEQKPVGQGTAQVIKSSDSVPADNGDGLANDLTWVGGFVDSGTYYVRVTNTSASPMQFALNLQ